MRKAVYLTVFFFIVGGCARSPVQGLDGSADFISQNQVTALDVANDGLLSPNMSATSRDTYITGKLFVIDRNYAHFEQALTKGEDARKLFGSLATIGMSSAAAVIPLGTTTKILNTTITAVQGAETSIDQDLLQQQAIQSIEKQMRTDRNNQATLIFDRMTHCSEDKYPIYIALSDLEAYRYAGTFESAIIGLGKTTSAVEAASKNNKDSPNSNPGTKLAADLVPSTAPGAFKCPISKKSSS